ncbi:hypothetical protein Syun_008598 [Stephania yunnanensis]|uniref:Uncharacterized protein n=1 Tax=Stephania yunnanensis TaxID=152371 RepID=A0AAP0KEW9_9MAGN
MVMQAVGMSFSKIVFLSGAAYTPRSATNGQLADILGILQLIGIRIRGSLSFSVNEVFCTKSKTEFIPSLNQKRNQFSFLIESASTISETEFIPEMSSAEKGGMGMNADSDDFD